MSDKGQEAAKGLNFFFCKTWSLIANPYLTVRNREKTKALLKCDNNRK